MSDELTYKGLTPNGLAFFEVKADDGKISKKIFHGIRCGLSWPCIANPGGYCCLVGQETARLITGQYPVSVLFEKESLTMGDLFSTMFDQMGYYGCTDIYSDLSPRFNSFILALDSTRRQTRPNQRITLKMAPYCGSFLHGLELIKKWLREVKALNIPRGTRIQQELREIKETDLKGDPEDRFYGINGLRYALGAVETTEILQPSKVENVKPLNPAAWT